MLLDTGAIKTGETLQGSFRFKRKIPWSFSLREKYPFLRGEKILGRFKQNNPRHRAVYCRRQGWKKWITLLEAGRLR